MALAFFLLNLQEFAFQTSPVVARDRVFGILLGLLVMWLIFDLLGGVRAAEQMVRRFRRGVRLLATLQELRDRIYRYYQETSGGRPSAPALATLSLSELITLTLRDLAHEPSSLEQNSGNSTGLGAVPESDGAQ